MSQILVSGAEAIPLVGASPHVGHEGRLGSPSVGGRSTKPVGRKEAPVESDFTGADRLCGR